MGGVKKVKVSEDVTEWPWAFSVDVEDAFAEALDKSNQIAFLTNHSRKYFPEDPGTSRFGVNYAVNLGSPEDPSPLKYSPKEPGLYRPVSLLGYGIGGLSGPRFPRDVHEQVPPPWHYQKDVVPRSQVKGRKDPYEHFITKSIRNSKLHESEKGNLLQKNPDEAFRVPESQLVKTKPTFRKCAHQIISFGTHRRHGRFGKEPKFNTAGVGHYDVDKPPRSVQMKGSFGMGPNYMIPSVLDRCSYKDYDACFECEEVISTSDYYRTSKRILNPLGDPVQEPESYFSEGTRTKASSPTTGKTQSVKTETKSEPAWSSVVTVPAQRSRIFVNLCRKCYCEGMRGENMYWNKEFLTTHFRKTRNCSYIHDHQKVKEFVNKTSCKTVNKLRRRETLLSKYYSDACEKVYKER